MHNGISQSQKEESQLLKKQLSEFSVLLLLLFFGGGGGGVGGGLILNVPVNSYGYVGTVNSPNHTFSCASLTRRLTSISYTYFRL